MTTATAPRPSAPDTNRAWTREDVAAYFQVSTTTVDTLRAKDPTFPKPVRILGSIRWRPNEVIAWFHGLTSSDSGQPVEPTRTVAPIAVPAAVPARANRRD